MSAVLNTNVASLWASKNLLGAQTKLATSVERLASGLRINRARDDAAGLGVANSLTAQINGANQGIRNLNDAVSSMQTGEGAIAAAQEMGQRILMLATQGANSTLGRDERTSILDEMKKLILAIDAIGGRTQFAGNPLLSYDATLGEQRAVYYSMQISNTPTDRVALDSSAFANVGGVVSIGQYTEAVEADEDAGVEAAPAFLTLGGALPPNIEGKKVYVVDDEGEVQFTGFTIVKGSGSADGKTYELAGELEADFDLPEGEQVSFAFGDGRAVSMASALFSEDLTNDPAEVDPTTITAAWQKVQERAAEYVKNLTTQRGLMGAYQNQMEYTLSNLTEL